MLDNYPMTILGTAEKRQMFWDEEDQEFFFDRHYYAFRAIFDFYRTGKLRRPLDIPLNIFIQEVQFFEIHKEVTFTHHLNLPLLNESSFSIMHNQNFLEIFFGKEF